MADSPVPTLSPSPFIPVDALGRPQVSDDGKRLISDALAEIPAGNSKALVFIADQHGARVHGAIKEGEHWKVGGVLEWVAHPPTGDGHVGFQVAVQASW